MILNIGVAYSKLTEMREKHDITEEPYYCFRIQNFKSSMILGPNYIGIAAEYGLACMDVFIICRTRQFHQLTLFMETLEKHVNDRVTSNSRAPRVGPMPVF